MKLRTVVLAGAIGFLGSLALGRPSKRSGVSDDDLKRRLPGDDLVANPVLVADRAGIIDAPADKIWPWLVQLGRARGGWYMPLAVERLLRPEWRGAWKIKPEYQSLAVGDIIPDYGPGDGKFKVMAIEAPRLLVFYSVRRPSAGWTWPQDDNPLPEDVLALSWVLMLEDAEPEQTRLYLRLRAVAPGGKMSPILKLAGGLVDYVTVELLLRGLKARLIPNRV